MVDITDFLLLRMSWKLFRAAGENQRLSHMTKCGYKAVLGANSRTASAAESHRLRPRAFRPPAGRHGSFQEIYADASRARHAHRIPISSPACRRRPAYRSSVYRQREHHYLTRTRSPLRQRAMFSAPCTLLRCLICGAPAPRYD